MKATNNIQQNVTTTNEIETLELGLINNIKSNIPHWGGEIDYDGKRVKLSNTCTIDNFLLALWILSKTTNLINNLTITNKTDYIKNIIFLIEQKKME